MVLMEKTKISLSRPCCLSEFDPNRASLVCGKLYHRKVKGGGGGEAEGNFIFA